MTVSGEIILDVQCAAVSHGDMQEDLEEGGGVRNWTVRSLTRAVSKREVRANMQVNVPYVFSRRNNWAQGRRWPRLVELGGRRGRSIRVARQLVGPHAWTMMFTLLSRRPLDMNTIWTVTVGRLRVFFSLVAVQTNAWITREHELQQQQQQVISHSMPEYSALLTSAQSKCAHVLRPSRRRCIWRPTDCAMH